MSARRVSSRLDSLSTRLWQEAIRLEKLHDQVDDCLAECEAIEPPRAIDYETAVAAITEAAKRLRAVSWTLSQADGALQEAAQTVQEAQDYVDELVPQRT